MFESKEGMYSDEQSFNFYFPCDQSFIIMESENRHGLFCMVLHKGSGPLEFGRYFVPASYDEIQHIFWEILEDGKNGRFAKDLSLRNVDSVLVNEFKAEKVNNKKRSQALTFSGHRGSKEDSRFCSIPLQDGDSEDSRQAFEFIFQATYEASRSDSKAIPRAVASIIESQKSRKEEKVSVDFNEIMNTYAHLDGMRKDNINIENNIPLWEQTYTLYEKHNELYTQFLSTVNQRYSVYLRAKETVEDRLVEAGRKLNDISSKTLKEKTEFKKAEEALFKSTAHIEAANKEVNHLLKKLEDVKAIIKRFPEMTDQEILDELRKNVSYLSHKIADLQNIAEAEKKRTKLKADYAKKKSELESTTRTIEDIDGSTLQTLSPNAASVMNSLKIGFDNLSGHFTDVGVQDIENFASHFKTDGNDTYFEDKLLHGLTIHNYSANEQRQQLTERHDELVEEMDRLSKSISDFDKHLASNKTDQENSLNSLNTKKSMLTADRVTLSGHGTLLENKTRLEETLAKYEDRVKSLTITKTEKYKLWQELYALESQNKTIYDSISKEENILNQWFKTLQSICLRSNIEMRTVNIPPDSKPICVEEITDFSEMKEQISGYNTDLNRNITILASKIKINGEDVDFTIRRSPSDLGEIIRKYSDVFNGLSAKKKLYLNDLDAHVKYVYSFIEELIDTRNIIHNFFGELNKSVNSVPISNLQEIKLKVVLNKKFESLLGTIEYYRKLAVGGDALFPQEFYEELHSFADSFFNTNKKVLNMHLIIEDIDYAYRLNGKTTDESKGQSGGTTTAINAIVIANLLDKLTPNYAKVRVPIVIDETSILDADNIISTINLVSEYGFSVFCATPEISSSVIRGTKYYLSIDSYNIDSPLHPDCNTMVLPYFIESIFEDREVIKGDGQCE